MLPVVAENDAETSKSMAAIVRRVFRESRRTAHALKLGRYRSQRGVEKLQGLSFSDSGRRAILIKAT